MTQWRLIFSYSVTEGPESAKWKYQKNFPEILISSPICVWIEPFAIYNSSYNCLPYSISYKIVLQTSVVPIK